jgi:hypothetical protein
VWQTWSAKVAIEWIERLRALIRYWTLRHLVDTRQEMDVVHLATGRPRVTPQRLRHEEDDKDRPSEPQSNPAVVLPYLNSIYHRCVYEGCRPIVKAGRIFVRQGLQGGYRCALCFLHNNLGERLQVGATVPRCQSASAISYQAEIIELS